MKIELTELWAAEIVVCGNDETLGIDGNDPEVVTEALSGCEAIFDKLLYNSWSFVEEDSNYRNWNGGKRKQAGYCNGFFAFDFFTRNVEELDENGDCEYGEWSWVGCDSVPSILSIGLETVLDKCNATISKAVEEYQNRKEEEEKEFSNED